MQQNRNIIVFFGVALVCLVFGAFAGVVFDREILRVANGYFAEIPNTGTGTSDSIDTGLIQEAWNKINSIYVDRPAVKTKELTYGAISGMVDALGDTGHSRFLTPQMVQDENSFTDGQLEGIGIEVQLENGLLKVVAPIDGSPAQKAGIHSGDIIQKVNGEDLSGKPLNEMVSKIKGPAGTSVTLTLLTPENHSTRDVTVQRAKIPIHNVEWQTVPGTSIAHLRISAFTKNAGADLIQALKEIKDRKMKGIILDLRNNPGGLLQEAVVTTSQFLADGDVMKQKNAQGLVTGLPVQKGGIATTIPMVVLVNQGSASASEIVSGALQDANRARLVGETTFGTGTVLNQFDLSDGSALLLATEEWLTPSGRVIWHKGIVPDVVSPLDSSVNLVTPISEENMTAQDLATSKDTQLLKALELLGQPVATSVRESVQP